MAGVYIQMDPNTWNICSSFEIEIYLSFSLSLSWNAPIQSNPISLVIEIRAAVYEMK